MLLFAESRVRAQVLRFDERENAGRHAVCHSVAVIRRRTTVAGGDTVGRHAVAAGGDTVGRHTVAASGAKGDPHRAPGFLRNKKPALCEPVFQNSIIFSLRAFPF